MYNIFRWLIVWTIYILYENIWFYCQFDEVNDKYYSPLTQYLKCICYFDVFLDCSFVNARLRDEDDIFLYILSMFICRCFVPLMFVSHLTSFHLVDVNWWCLIKLNRKSWCFSNIAWHYSCKGKGNCVQFRNLKKENSHFSNA